MVLGIPAYESMAQTTPFTTRDNVSYLQKVNGLREKLNELIDSTNGNFVELTDKINLSIESLSNQWNDELAAVVESHIVQVLLLRTEVIEQLSTPGTPAHDAVLEAAGDVYDPATAGLVANPSDTRNALDLRYVGEAELDAKAATLFESATATRDAAELALDGRYSKKSGLAWNVLDFGAKGDGVTDDSGAIQDAIDAAKVKGGIVYMPPGDYKINTTLNLSGIHPDFDVQLNPPTISLIGAGRHATYLRGGESGYGFIELIGSNRILLEGFTIRGDIPLQYGILGGRTTGDASSGEHVFRDITIWGNFDLAGIFMLSAEITGYEGVTVYTQRGPALVLARDMRGWIGTAKYAPISTTFSITGGNGVISLHRCMLLTIGLASTDHPLVLEYVQTFTADGLYTVSSGAALIMMRKGVWQASFRGLHQEWNHSIVGAVQPYGFLETNYPIGPLENSQVKISIEGSSIYSIKGEGNGDAETPGATWNDFSVKSTNWRGDFDYQFDVWISYNAQIQYDPRGGTIAEQLSPVYRIRGAGDSNQSYPNRYSTANRPPFFEFGQGRVIFDTTLNKPLWAGPAGWLDATGTIV